MPHVAARTASRDRDTGRYQSHRPEQTLLYQIVDEYYPAFAALMAEQGKELPGYVQREFEEFLQCGRLEHGLSTGSLRVLPRRAPGRFQL
ncbi:transposase [Klebsiella pneumoniae]|nr:transposase [Klebsiella pneumoniae]